ncbi:MAG: DUF169 domain-containing protein [Desulfobacterales bacterium]
MKHFQRVSQDIVKSLSLQYEPVGVVLYKDSEPLPDSPGLTQGEFKSYCQALILAAEGKALLLEKEQIGLGCRLKSGIGPCHLMMGIPGDKLDEIYKHTLDLAKPIAMLNKHRAGA